MLKKIPNIRFETGVTRKRAKSPFIANTTAANILFHTAIACLFAASMAIGESASAAEVARWNGKFSGNSQCATPLSERAGPDNLNENASVATSTPGKDQLLRGRWVGFSNLENNDEKVKTTLAVGSSGNSEIGLSFEGRRDCMLKHGKFEAQNATVWELTFTEGSGSESCKRLANRVFILRLTSEIQLQFDVDFPNPNGSEVRRQGFVSRYP